MSLHVGIPLFALAALVQATILPHLRVSGGQPDLILLMVISWAILDRDREGMAWAFAGGLFLDVLSGAPLGISSLLLLPIAYGIGLIETTLFHGSVLLPLLLTLAGALIYHVGYLLLLRFFADTAIPWSAAFSYVTLPSVLLDVVLILPALSLLTRLYRRLHPRQLRL